MFPDVPFEADFLRAALLLGLVREADVSAWAEALLETEADPQGRLADVSLAPHELTAMREVATSLSCGTSGSHPIGGRKAWAEPCSTPPRRGPPRTGVAV